MEIEQINIHSLPSLPLSERKSLPNTNGLYFVFGNDELTYIGMTASFHQRWLAHHKISQFKSLPNAKIAYLETQDLESLESLEKQAILFFNPKLNGRKRKNTIIHNAMASIKLPAELLEKARMKSENTGVSISFVVRKAIEDWVNETSKN